MQLTPLPSQLCLKTPSSFEAVFRMAQGVRKFLAKDTFAKLPKGEVHLMVAKQDQYVSRTTLDNFWDSIPSEVRASRVIIDGSEHKIPEAAPIVAAEWLIKIIDRDPALQAGDTFELNARTGRISRSK